MQDTFLITHTVDGFDQRQFISSLVTGSKPYIYVCELCVILYVIIYILTPKIDGNKNIRNSVSFTVILNNFSSGQLFKKNDELFL